MLLVRCKLFEVHGAAQLRLVKPSEGAYGTHLYGSCSLRSSSHVMPNLTAACDTEGQQGRMARDVILTSACQP